MSFDLWENRSASSQSTELTSADIKKLKVLLSTLLQRTTSDEALVAFDSEFTILGTFDGLDRLGGTCDEFSSLFVLIKIDWQLYLVKFIGLGCSIAKKGILSRSEKKLCLYFSMLPMIEVNAPERLKKEEILERSHDLKRDPGLNEVKNVLKQLRPSSTTPRKSEIETVSGFINAAINEVQNPESPFCVACDKVFTVTTEANWAKIGVTLSEFEKYCLTAEDMGSGGIEEASLTLKDDELSFLLIQFPVGDRRISFKHVLVTWVGPECSRIFQKLSQLGHKIQKAVSNIHIDILISEKAKLNHASVLRRLRQFTVTDEIMLRVVQMNSKGDPCSPHIIYVDQEYTIADVKNVIFRKLGIPVLNQSIWRMISRTGRRASVDSRYGSFTSEKEFFDKDGVLIKNDLGLSNGDRIFVTDDTLRQSLSFAKMNVAEQRSFELNTLVDAQLTTEEKNPETSPWINFDDLIYVEDDLVGRGKTASVYRAIWIVAEVALKKWNYHSLTDKLLNSFLDEVHTLRALNHPNIVRFVGACREPFLALVTEWVPRGSLHDLLLNPSIKISQKHVIRMALEVARGMQYLHQKHFIHRDLKSHNLLVDEEWTVKVADFGIARILDEESVAYSLFHPHLTNFRLTSCGTSGWIAPEVYDAVKEYGIGGYTNKIDVFSYGVCLWEMASRSKQNPLSGLFEDRFKELIRLGNLPPFPEETDKGFVDLAKRCMRYEPIERPSFDEIVPVLETLYTNSKEL